MATYSVRIPPLLRKRTAFATLLAGALFVLFLWLNRALSVLAEIGAVPYIPFELSTPLPIPAPVRSPLKPVHDLPTACLESHFASGDPCHSESVNPIDVLWTWVNGSDVMLDEAKNLATSRYSPNDPYRPLGSRSQARMFRDHDELRYSMRSVLANFREHAGRFHLVTADFPAPDSLVAEDNIGSIELWRLGQIPQWLDLDSRGATALWQDQNVELSVVHHAELFRPYIGTNFNSLAIESQFVHIDNISDYFIYMNDDLFMLNPLTPVSFYTSPYGIVLHLQPDLLVRPERLVGNNEGEWRSLGESNFLLSQRFGSRRRPYVVHEAKVASRALLHEMSQIWPETFAKSATHLFRETVRGDGDINTMFMLSHFVVERAREALLWSWVVGRVGGLDDSWGEVEAQQAWAELGGLWNERNASLLVQAGWRDTLPKVEKALFDSGYEPQQMTTYLFSSLDGYPYTGLGGGGRPDWPRMAPHVPESSLPTCSIDYNECFVNDGSPYSMSSASEVFKNIAFRKGECGDCIILALLRSSGKTGLSAFLPPTEKMVPPLPDAQDNDQVSIPHLALSDDWQTGKFSLHDTLDTDRYVNVRDWTLELLQRYRFVIGGTPSLFERIVSPQQTDRLLHQIQRNRNVALLCLNDDVVKLNDEVTNVLKRWLDTRWPQPAAWEH